MTGNTESRVEVRTNSFHGGVVKAYFAKESIEDFGDCIRLTESQWKKYCKMSCDRGESICACGGAQVVFPDGRVFGGGDGPYERSLDICIP
jgi:hypothetical protein